MQRHARAISSAATAGARRCASAIGARLAGDPVVQRVQSSYIRAPELLSAADDGARLGQHLAQPAPQRHRLRDRRPRDLAGPQLPARRRGRFRRRRPRLGDPRHPRRRRGLSRTRCISHEDWIGRRLVADRFRDRRVFLCGDAAHIWVPYAGYGMNAGMADAAEPRLAARRARSTAGATPASSTPTSASACRSPSRCRVSRWTMRTRWPTQRRGVPPEIEDDDAGGRCGARGGRPGGLRPQRAAVLLRRAELRLLLRRLADHRLRRRSRTRPTRWATSRPRPCPAAARRTSGCATAARSTTRSARSTRCCASIRRSTWAVCSPLPPRAACRCAARRRGGRGRAAYDTRLVLSRPDQHVAWRGDAPPEDALALIDRIRGALTM